MVDQPNKRAAYNDSAVRISANQIPDRPLLAQSGRPLSLRLRNRQMRFTIDPMSRSQVEQRAGGKIYGHSPSIGPLSASVGPRRSLDQALMKSRTIMQPPSA